mgnify:FL=1
MFRIRREQLEHFADRAREEFLAKMRAYLRESFAELVSAMNDAELSAWLRDALGRCERFGVDTEPEAAQLVLLYLVLGLDAHEQYPWAREALEDPVLVPLGKLRRLVRAARAEGIAGIEDVLVYEEMAERELEAVEA